MKGTILDFLRLAAEKPELARELAELAARHGFEFAPEELSDSELAGVTGGTLPGSGMQLGGFDLQNNLQQQPTAMQTISNLSRLLHDTSLSIVRNLR